MTGRFAEQHGPWAFVAGASTGIGAALSHEAGRRGLNVLMMARGAAQLEERARSVRQAHSVALRRFMADNDFYRRQTPMRRLDRPDELAPGPYRFSRDRTPPTSRACRCSWMGR